ncbi:MotA/TolQ/ExbB proton channel family protein [Psychrilyobacter sp.]|uniref:MotA/TolQ/ExbB proton channel family protein n=1 Tax=Psychrilyobacter sp. TaxID=2586924 RepID=UPI003015BADE
MIEIFKSGGMLMYGILLLSILGTTVIIERFVYFLKNEKGIKNQLKAQLEEAITSKDKELAISLCESGNSSSLKVLKELILEHDFDEKVDIEYLEEKARERALIEIPKLENHMWLLGVVAHVTPLVGLLGTVSGMIVAFRVIAVVGSGKPEMLADGISQALITTAAGLTVAIPALILYNYYNKKIDHVVNEIERTAVEFINSLRK